MLNFRQIRAAARVLSFFGFLFSAKFVYSQISLPVIDPHLLYSAMPGTLQPNGLYHIPAETVTIIGNVQSVIPERYCLPGISATSGYYPGVQCAQLPLQIIERVMNVDVLSSEVQKLKEKNDQLLTLIQAQSQLISKQREELELLKTK
ncbi:MAG: hypothetical protein QM709_03150 [Spongiibacteraceae bacterium]